jgi:hypothetical protein
MPYGKYRSHGIWWWWNRFYGAYGNYRTNRVYRTYGTSRKCIDDRGDRTHGNYRKYGINRTPR